MRILIALVFSLVFLKGNLHAQSISQIVKEYVKSHYPDYKVLRVSAPSADIKGKARIELEFQDKFYLRFNVSGDLNGKEKTFPVSVRVVKLKSVLIASKDILPKQLIIRKYLSYKKVPEYKVNGGFSSIDDILGKRAKRLIKKDRIIKQFDVIPDFKVFKNRPVKVIYANGAIKIEMMGIALKNGAIGDIIEVKNISTGKKLLCKVIGNGVVEFLR